MRMQLPEKLEAGRIQGDRRWGAYGAFDLHGPCGERLRIVASGADADDLQSQGWEHVSVSTRRRPPNWQEMSFVKDLFWEPEECVVQFHPPRSEYVNNHPHCLHLWRNKNIAFPLPPSVLVGVKGIGPLTADEAAILNMIAGR
jgi:hypothetical protein